MTENLVLGVEEGGVFVEVEMVRGLWESSCGCVFGEDFF